MSTRSHINIVLKDNSIKSIYVHSDGYPDGVGRCLIDNYNSYEKAVELFNYGNASYLGSTINECSFYGRDWNRDEEPARKYNNVDHYMLDMRGDIWIEYIYLFQNGIWKVSSLEYTKTKNGFDDSIGYFSKFLPVREHKNFTGEKHNGTEVKMLGDLKKMLEGSFGADGVLFQGQKLKKPN